MIVTLALVYAKRHIHDSDRYEVRMDDIYDAIAERGNRSGYKFAPKAIAADVRREIRDHYGRSNLPDLLRSESRMIKGKSVACGTGQHRNCVIGCECGCHPKPKK